MVLVGLMFWGFSFLTTVPESWWASWAIGIVLVVALALFIDSRKRTR